MYHYVRPDDAEFPYFRSLHVEDFCRQLEYFQEAFGYVSKADFLEVLDGRRDVDGGVVLTFDDGVSDHFEYVLPELQRRGLWGIFYVPTGMYSARKMLDVHRIHCLLGKAGGPALIDQIKQLITAEMLSHAHVDAFRKATYSRQENDQATTEFKRILNYYVSYEYRGGLLDRLMSCYFDESKLLDRYYVNAEQLAQMQAAGMVVGGHSVSHPVMSKLTEAEQQNEIHGCFAYLEQATGGLPLKTFCYPYGGFHSFTAATESLLADFGCRFSLNVEPRDATASDFAERPQALPRFDCNAFPHGKCRPIAN